MLYTDLYCNPTSSQSYLLVSSTHRVYCKKSIPYSQFVWIRCVCSSLDNFDKHALEFASYFHRRGYSSQLEEDSYIKARWMNKNHLLDLPNNPEVPKRSEDNTILVTRPYTESFHPIRKFGAKLTIHCFYIRRMSWEYTIHHKIYKIF